MIFSDRVLFLHVPKAGGSSLVRYLMDVLPKPVHYSIPADHQAEIPDGVVRFDGIAHESLEEARHVLAQRGRRLDDFDVVLACVRNPYDLEVSRYSFLRSDLSPYNHGPQQALALRGDFELFACCARPHGRRPLEAYYLLEGEVPANLRILRLETIDRDLADALADAGVDGAAAEIPHHNRSREDDPFETHYTPAAEQAVYEKYKWVFDAGLYPRLQVDGGRGVAGSAPAQTPGSDGDDFAQANAWLAEAEVQRWHGRAEEQEAALERAFEHALAFGSDRLTTRVADELARCVSLSGRGTVAQGIARCAALAEATHGTWGGGGAKLVLAELLAASGRFDEARALCDEVRDANPRLALASASYAGSVELLAGDAAAAAARFDDGWWADQNVAADRAEALCRLERYDEVERIARFVEATAPATDARLQARWRRLRAELLAHRGDAPAGVELARAAVAIAAECDAPNVHADALADLAGVLARAGDDRGSAEALDAARERYAAKGNVAKLQSSTPASASAARTAGSQSVATSTARSSR